MSSSDSVQQVKEIETQAMEELDATVDPVPDVLMESRRG